MVGYRDEREAAGARLAELQAKLDEHRQKRLAVIEMRKKFAIANPPRISGYFQLAALIVLLVLFFTTVNASPQMGWSAMIPGLVLLGLFWLLMTYALGGTRPNPELVRLDRERKREIEEEERLCAALEEEIEQVRKLLAR